MAQSLLMRSGFSLTRIVQPYQAFLSASSINFSTLMRRDVRKPTITYCPSCRRMSLLDIEPERIESFVKGLYVANIDLKWIFPFPTVENSRDLNSFNESLAPLHEFLTDNEINSAKLDTDAEIPEELINKLKELRLFGLTIPQSYGGLGLTNLKLCKVLEEVATSDNSVNMMIASHNLLGVKASTLIGYTNLQYTVYNTKSDLLVKPAYFYSSRSGDFNTRARLSADGRHWLISGEKTSINNGAIADLMIVFAKLEVKDVDDEIKDTIAAFIVEKDFGGIYNGPQEDKMGMRALNTSDIMFDETPVPLENMIGEERDGFKIATETLNESRLGLACGIIGPMRQLVQEATAYADTRVQFGKRIKDFQLVKERIFLMAENIYAMESVAYLTMGKYDQAAEEGKVHDLSVESAVAKIFIAQKASEIVNDCLELFGYRGYTKVLSCERMMRDVKMLSVTEGTNDVLKLYIALSCFKHTQNHAEEKMRHYKQGSLKLFMRVVLDNLRDHHGSRYLHKGMLRKRIPSFGLTTKQATKSWLDERLDESGEHFEEAVVGFYRKAFNHLRHFGNTLQDEQLRLRRFAEMSISLYAMAAVLARCNKSLVLGLRDVDREYLIASTFMYKMFRDCGLMMEEAKSNYGISRDSHAKRVGKELIEERRYALPHPLELEHKFVENPIFLKSFDNVLKSLPK